MTFLQRKKSVDPSKLSVEQQKSCSFGSGVIPEDKKVITKEMGTKLLLYIRMLRDRTKTTLFRVNGDEVGGVQFPRNFMENITEVRGSSTPKMKLCSFGTVP